jgi:hypothetical protein
MIKSKAVLMTEPDWSIIGLTKITTEKLVDGSAPDSRSFD